MNAIISETKLGKSGKAIAIVGIQFNPTVEWMATISVYHAITGIKLQSGPPLYGNSVIEAVILAGGDLSDQKTQCALLYDFIRWPHGKSTVMRAIELPDGSLWEEMTDTIVPISVHPGESPIRGEQWEDNWLLRQKADRCLKLIGPMVTKLYLIRRLTGEALQMHNERLAKS